MAIEMPDVPDNLVIGADTPSPEPASPTPAPVADNPTPEPAPVATATVPSTPSPSNPANPADGEQKFEIKVDGKVEFLTRAEMTALAQQGKAFTQKTQKLADEQRRWEADQKAIIAREKENAIREYREQLAREKLEAEKDPTTRLSERLESMEQKLEDEKLDSALRTLLTKYEIDEQHFLIEASRAGLKSAADVQARGEEIAKSISDAQTGKFESRFKDILTKGEHPELKALQAKWLAEYLAKKGNPGPVPPSAGPVAPTTAPKKARTFDEAADIAEEMLTGQPVRH